MKPTFQELVDAYSGFNDESLKIWHRIAINSIAINGRYPSDSLLTTNYIPFKTPDSQAEWVKKHPDYCYILYTVEAQVIEYILFRRRALSLDQEYE